MLGILLGPGDSVVNKRDSVACQSSLQGGKTKMHLFRCQIGHFMKKDYLYLSLILGEKMDEYIGQEKRMC